MYICVYSPAFSRLYPQKLKSQYHNAIVWFLGAYMNVKSTQNANNINLTYQKHLTRYVIKTDNFVINFALTNHSHEMNQRKLFRIRLQVSL